MGSIHKLLMVATGTLQDAGSRYLARKFEPQYNWEPHKSSPKI